MSDTNVAVETLAKEIGKAVAKTAGTTVAELAIAGAVLVTGANLYTRWQDRKALKK